MKAITLHRPWAWCVAHAGKDFENRTWRPPESIIGQQIAIHAGKKYDRVGAVWLIRNEVCVPPGPSVDVHSAIVAVTTVDGWKDDFVVGPWFSGPVGWILTDTITLPTPVPCVGRQGLWTVPTDIERQVRYEMSMAT
jgi:hypothetical protein